MKLKIDNELKNLIPTLTSDEFGQLEKNILENGVQDSIKTWHGLIIDGHNRYEIAQRHGLKFDTKELSFNDRSDVVVWMINNQAGRRNLSTYDKGLLALKLQDILKVKGKENQGARTDISQTSVKCEDRVDSQKQAAKTFNVSHDTLSKVKHIEENAPIEIKKKLKNNDITVNKAYQDIKKAERKKEVEEKVKVSATKRLPTNIRLLEGDIFSLINQVEDNSVDLLCTDPPYYVLSESWDVFDSKHDFLGFTEKWLNAVMPKIKDTGRMYISFAHDYVFDLYNIFLKHNFYDFNFYGQIIWVKKNNNQKFNRKGYRLTFEPIIYLYGKNAENLNFTEYGEIQSNVWEIAIPQSNFKEGKFHPTQKPQELYRRIIETGSVENDLVLDCFAGSGTTGIVCKELSRKCILIEKEQKYIDIIKGRVNNVD